MSITCSQHPNVPDPECRACAAIEEYDLMMKGRAARASSPTSTTGTQSDVPEPVFSPELTFLRDSFAAQAMNGILSHRTTATSNLFDPYQGRPADMANTIASVSYLLADAMLAARARTLQG